MGTSVSDPASGPGKSEVDALIEAGSHSDPILAKRSRESCSLLPEMLCYCAPLTPLNLRSEPVTGLASTVVSPP